MKTLEDLCGEISSLENTLDDIASAINPFCRNCDHRKTMHFMKNSPGVISYELHGCDYHKCDCSKFDGGL